MTDSFKKSVECSNSSFSMSGTGSSQARYKKALKQISRLVSYNNTLKKDVDTWQNNYRKLQNQYDGLESKYEDAVKLIKELQQKINNLQQGRHVPNINNLNKNITTSVGQSLDYQVHTSREQIQHQSLYHDHDHDQEQNHHHHQKQIYMTQQINQLQQKINQKQDLITELQLALQNKHLKIIQLEGRCGDFNEEMFRIKNQQKQKEQLWENQKGKIVQKQKQRERLMVIKEKQKEKENKLTINSVLDVQQLKNYKRKTQELEQKLKQAEQWSKKVQSDYQRLRKQLIYGQNNSLQSIPTDPFSASIPLSQQKMPNIVRLQSSQTEHPYPSASVSGYTTPPYQLLAQYPKQTNPSSTQTHLQHQLSSLKREFNGKKHKYKQQINNLRSQNQQLNNRLSTMMGLITKQQQYIENFVQSHQQIDHDEDDVEMMDIGMRMGMYSDDIENGSKHNRSQSYRP